MSKSFQNIIFYLVLYSLIPAFACAQKKDVKFSHYTNKEGLSINTVQSIVQDKKGYIWLGTTNGLNRFDGNDFVIYSHLSSDTNSLSNNIIWDILVDNIGNLWIGTENGLNVYNLNTDNFKRYNYIENDSTSLSSPLIKDILQASDSQLWIATYSGTLCAYNPKTDNFTQHKVTVKNGKYTNERINCIAEDAYSNLWIGTEGGGVYVYNPKTKKIKEFQNIEGDASSLSHNIVRTILVDSKNTIWLGTAIGLDRFVSIKEGFVRFKNDPNNETSIPPGMVDVVFEDSKGQIWVGIDGGGLNQLVEKEKFVNYNFNPQNRNSISSNIIRSIYEDKAGNLWVGTFNSGLNLHNKLTNPFESFFHSDLDPYSISNSSVMAFLEDSKGNFWIGTDGGGINLYNSKFNSFRQINSSSTERALSSSAILCLYEDKDEQIWVGTFNGGLNKFNPKSKTFINYITDYSNPQSLSNPHVWKIFEDSRNNFWIGTMGGGLNLLNRETGVFKNYQFVKNDSTSLSSYLIWEIFEDSKGRLWIGTHDGLNQYLYDKDAFISYQFDEEDSTSLSNNWVLNVFEDSYNDLWVSTYGGGFSKFNPDKGTFKSFTSKDGLPSDIVLGAIEDDYGSFWLSTKGGIVKFNPQTFEIQVFGESYGIRSNELNIGAFYKSKKGELFFGSNDGFERFKPEQVVINTEVPQIVLTDLSILNKTIHPAKNESRLKRHISEAKEIQLTYKDYSFSLGYSALNYFASDKFNYSYKLEGFDKEWNEVGQLRIATYTNLDPGEYTFVVKASNNAGVWNNTGTKIKIIVAPPWWEHKWIRSGFALLIVLILYIIYVIRIKSVENHRKVLKQEVKSRTNELHESNAQLEEMNQEIMQQKEELITQAEILARTNKKLETSTIELEEHRNNLEELVKQRTKELEKSKEKAEESDRLKTAFLANMSHEIRTPMNAIVGFSNLLKQQSLSHEEKDNYTAQITANTSSLLMLIDDILDLSMMESNLLIIKPKEFELNVLMDEVFLDGSIRNPNLDLRINNDVEESNFVLKTDRHRLKQILVNLFNNACKFTNEGFIELSCIIEKEFLVFSVQDTGIGISQENLDIIFNRFRKITNEKTKLFRGAGLGLAISKRIAELLGGELRVESKLGVGSKFMLYLPIDLIEYKSTVINEKQLQFFNWSNKKLLIVEDEEANYSYLESALKPTKINIEWAVDGSIAVDLFKQGKIYDLVLMDIKMPNMNGFEANMAIKEINPKQIVVAQTAFARPEDLQEIKESKFDNHLIKPIIPQDLYNLLNVYLSR